MILLPLAIKPETLVFIICQRALYSYLVILVIAVINKFLEAVFTFYSNQERFRNKPLKGLLQTAQVILYIIGTIIVISIILDKSPAVNKNLTCMVRQLQPTETGIPLELYLD